MDKLLENWVISDDVRDTIDNCQNVIVPKTREEIFDLAIGNKDNKIFHVTYNVEGRGEVEEANVVKCKNGLCINYTEAYMRRRDPNCMVVNNIEKTDKVKYTDRFHTEFDGVRTETLNWLKQQDLIVLPFMAGGKEYGYEALLVAPKNSAFFAASIYDMQEVIPLEDLDIKFKPKAIIYVAPPFRHTHFDGKQVVVHNNQDGVHEVFSYNLYPGPSAKKGVYGILLALGLKEEYLTMHASTVDVVTPYDNDTTILHEGASGSGKSEMLEYVHREEDGRLKLGENILTGEKRYLELGHSCKLHPITDDMALSNPEFQKNGKLAVTDAENAWFIRIDHINKYGTDPHLEKITIHPEKPLLFFNIQGHPDATCLIWEHIKDEDGKTCSNPRIIIPRELNEDIQDGPVDIDYRSFGLRTPPCTKENPSYGIFGMMHVLPPALAWLWRLVAPRGFNNPSIDSSADENQCDIKSEGVGSFWPFATGKRVDFANILLEQFMQTTKTKNILIPNQHIGCWEVGFMAQWVIREYLARRGQASMKKINLHPARHPLAGYIPEQIHVEGVAISKKFLDVTVQPEIGLEGYDEGAKQLEAFFKRETQLYLQSSLHPLGKAIISCCLDNGTLDDYEKIIPGTY